MKITNLVQQKKNINKVNLFLDEKYWTSITKDQLLELGIHKNFEITEALKNEIEELSKESKQYSAAENYILVRPRSIKEVRDYLIQRRELDLEQATKIINKLIERNFLSDEKFARWYIENKLNSSKHGELYLISWLAKKGVKSSISKGILNELREENQDDLEIKLKDNVQKLSKQIRAKDLKELKIKITRRMMSRGFRYNEFKKYIDELEI